MPEQISNHRLGAFVYGFVSGVGLIMVIWGLASITTLPSTNLMMNIGLVMFGVALFAGGSCREAYLRGNLSVLSEGRADAERNRSTRPVTNSLLSEQLVPPEEVTSRKAHEA
jgi:hypothetical protein